jgi:hypothetical protein
MLQYTPEGRDFGLTRRCNPATETRGERRRGSAPVAETWRRAGEGGLGDLLEELLGNVLELDEGGEAEAGALEGKARRAAARSETGGLWRELEDAETVGGILGDVLDGDDVAGVGVGHDLGGDR